MTHSDATSCGWHHWECHWCNWVLMLPCERERERDAGELRAPDHKDQRGFRRGSEEKLLLCRPCWPIVSVTSSNNNEEQTHNYTPRCFLSHGLTCSRRQQTQISPSDHLEFFQLRLRFGNKRSCLCFCCRVSISFCDLNKM